MRTKERMAIRPTKTLFFFGKVLIINACFLNCMECFVLRNKVLKSSHGSAKALVENSPSCNYVVVPCPGDESSIARASKFMLESFWIPQGVTAATTQIANIEWAVKDDLMQRYGETTGGKRKFDSRLLLAVEQSDSNPCLIGMVGADVTLFCKDQMVLHKRSDSENLLNGALAALGPKQRRQYKGSSIQTIVQDLLPMHQPTVVLSNLAVSPNHRRQGIAFKLCKEVERVVKDEWSFDKLHLRVESSNDAARALYEKYLNYRLDWVERDAVALRVDLATGNFVECTSDTLTLVKSL